MTATTLIGCLLFVSILCQVRLQRSINQFQQRLDTIEAPREAQSATRLPQRSLSERVAILEEHRQNDDFRAEFLAQYTFTVGKRKLTICPIDPFTNAMRLKGLTEFKQGERISVPDRHGYRDFIFEGIDPQSVLVRWSWLNSYSGSAKGVTIFRYSASKGWY